MAEIFDRTKVLIGDEGLQKLQSSNVLVVGVGGVGGYALEVLARSGVGKFTICDGDVVDITNINRQIIATHSTIGLSKVQVFCERLKDINPAVNVRAFDVKFNEQTAADIFDEEYDYVVDAIDSVQDKLLLIKTAKQRNIPIISAMGAGNRLDMVDFEVMDIFDTKYDKLAKKFRSLLRDNGVSNLDVVCNNAKPVDVSGSIIGSTAYMPPLAGIKMGGYVVTQLLKNKENKIKR